MSLPKFKTASPFGDGRAVADLVRPALEPFLDQGYALVTDPTKMFSKYDADTNTGIVVPYIVFHGRTRIQPLRTALFSKTPPNDTTTRVIQFWFEWTKDDVQPLVEPGFQVAVIDGGNDPTLTNYQYTVTGSPNSSMAWQRTVETQTDLERRPNYITEEKTLTGLPVGAEVATEFLWDGEWHRNYEARTLTSEHKVFAFRSDIETTWRVVVDGEARDW